MPAGVPRYSAALIVRAGLALALAFFFGRGATAWVVAALAGVPLWRRAERRVGRALANLAARAYNRPTTCSRVTVSGVMPLGSVALMPS